MAKLRLSFYRDDTTGRLTLRESEKRASACITRMEASASLRLAKRNRFTRLMSTRSYVSRLWRKTYATEEVITGAAGSELACVNENLCWLVCQFFFSAAPKWFAHEKLSLRANNDCKWSCM